MTLEHPGLKLPQWAIEVGVLLLVAVVSYTAATLRAGELATARYDIRLAALEKQATDFQIEQRRIAREQEVNSQFRAMATEKLTEIDELKQLLLVHMGRTR